MLPAFWTGKHGGLTVNVFVNCAGWGVMGTSGVL